MKHPEDLALLYTEVETHEKKRIEKSKQTIKEI